jgi:hypothetical protein
MAGVRDASGNGSLARLHGYYGIKKSGDFLLYIVREKQAAHNNFCFLFVREVHLDIHRPSRVEGRFLAGSSAFLGVRTCTTSSTPTPNSLSSLGDSDQL